MGFSRAVAPVRPPEAATLTEDMAGIGMNLGGRANHRANIENTLLFASEEGMDRADLRVLSVLVTWLGIHGARVNVDRLAKLVEAGGSKRVRAFWAAVGRWLAKDRRYVRLIRFPKGEPIDLLDVGTGFQIRRHGEDPRFEESALRVPANVLRDRPADVMTPGQLARNHGLGGERTVPTSGALQNSDQREEVGEPDGSPDLERSRACIGGAGLSRDSAMPTISLVSLLP